MNDQVDTTEAADVPGTAEAPSPAPGASAQADDLGPLLSEYDRSSTAAKADPSPSAPEREARSEARGGLSHEDLLRLELGEVSNRVVLQSVLDHQIAHAERIHRENQARQEREDFAETVDEAADMLEGAAHVGDAKTFARRWLLSQAALDPHLAEAWQHRRDSPEHNAYAVRALKRAFKAMRAEVDRMPDPEATEDRALVAQAVRGASRTAPAGRAPDYSRMTDSEFEREKIRVMG